MKGSRVAKQLRLLSLIIGCCFTVTVVLVFDANRRSDDMMAAFVSTAPNSLSAQSPLPSDHQIDTKLPSKAPPVFRAVILDPTIINEADSSVVMENSESAPISSGETNNQQGEQPIETGNRRKRQVVLAHMEEDLRWLKNPLLWTTDDLNITVYSHTPLVPETTFIPPNEGCEAHLYLQWIIDNYDNLPDKILFMHAHESGRHCFSNLKAILCSDWDSKKGFFYPLVIRPPPPPPPLLPPRPYKPQGVEDYQNLTKYEEFDFDPKEFKYIKWLNHEWNKFWKPMLGEKPKRIGTYIAAQFMVSKERILARPLSQWQAMKRWVLARPKRWEDASRATGFGMEFIWHIVMGEPAILPRERIEDVMKCW